MVSAQQVSIIDTLDLTKFNASTFTFNSFGFGDRMEQLNVIGQTQFTRYVDLRPEDTLVTKVEGKIDLQTGIVLWKFTSLDPQTMLLTDDALAGFLPPNDSTGRGEGFVSFSIKPYDTLQTGITIANNATIVFDYNSPIGTDTVQNTIDNIKPDSYVHGLLPLSADTSFTVQWTGSDNLSGVQFYDIYVSKDDSAYVLWQSNIGDTSALFSGINGSKYKFYSVATDSAGNVEGAPLVADDSTFILVGINELDALKKSMSIYPNPTSGIFSLSFVNFQSKKYDLRITDLLGRCIICQTLDAKEGFNKSTFDLSEAQPGVYIVELKFSDGTVARKLVKN